jgi:hypothetical protein
VSEFAEQGKPSMTFMYSAVTRFDPNRGDDWQEYIEWSGLSHLREVLSLDSLLCPTIVETLTDEDWQYNIHEDHKTHLFHNLDYLLRRIAGNKQVNVLAVMHEPSAADVCSFVDSRFVFRGFDLIETDGGISALSNCGGFDKSFSSADLSEYGLLTDYAKAVDVQQLLIREYPEEHHAECDLWAIWMKIS